MGLAADSNRTHERTAQPGMPAREGYAVPASRGGEWGAWVGPNYSFLAVTAECHFSVGPKIRGALAHPRKLLGAERCPLALVLTHRVDSSVGLDCLYTAALAG